MMIFVAIAVTGFIFLAVSALFGDHDHEVHVEAHDVGLGEHPSPFSLRVISLFLTAFGAAGAMARAYGTGYTVASAIGTGAGLVVGFAGYKLIMFFMGQQASSLVESEDMVGAIGQVSVTIPPGGVGQVSVAVREKRIYPMARAASADISIEQGAQVKVVRSAGNTVYVEKL